MNLAPFNGSAFNGGGFSYVQLEGDATIALAGTGALIVGATLTGTAGIALTADGSISARVALRDGDATITLDGTGQGYSRVNAMGYAAIALDGTGQLQRRAMLQGGLADIHFNAVGELVVRGKVFSAAGQAYIRLDGINYGGPSRGIIPSGLATITLDGVGSGRLAPANSSDGLAKIAFGATGELRIGNKVGLTGEATISIFARGRDPRTFRYAWLDGRAAVELMAFSLGVGTPPLPVEFIPTPLIRSMVAPYQPRTMYVPPEHRG